MYTERRTAWFSQFGWQDILAYTNSIDALLLVAYLFPIAGGMSLSLTLPAYLAWLRSKDPVITASATIPVIASVLFFGHPIAGLAIAMAQPLVPLLVGAAVSILTKRRAILLLGTLILEHIFVIWMNVTSDIILVGAIVTWALAVSRMSIATFKSYFDSTGSETSA